MTDKILEDIKSGKDIPTSIPKSGTGSSGVCTEQRGLDQRSGTRIERFSHESEKQENNKK